MTRPNASSVHVYLETPVYCHCQLCQQEDTGWHPEKLSWGQHVDCPGVRVDLPALHNCKITTKVNIWGQVYFGETSSSLVSKIRNTAGCMWFEASCQRTLSQGSTVLLFVAAWECASKPPLSCPFICADPLPMVGRLYLTNFGRLPPPALTSMTPA